MEVNPIVHTKARLESGAHEIDRYFGSHLTGESRLVFGEDPASYIKFPDYDARTTLLSYIRHKKRSIASVFTAERPDYYKSLQRILELPLAVGRKALLAIDELEGTHQATADSANKARVVPASIKLFASLGLLDTPSQILSTNSEYTEALNQRLNGEIPEHDYVDFLHEIEDCGEAASVWLDELDSALSAKFVN